MRTGQPLLRPGTFLSHQALYELSLIKSRGANAINAARGRILYNFSGNGCEGYTSEFRQVSELNSGEGKMTLSDLRSTSWEDGAGKSYRFKIDTRMNDSEASPVDGMAERTGNNITVKLKQPVAKTFNLEGNVVFPTEQIHRIIDAARSGKPVLELTVYDGSDNGEKVYNTLSVIGRPMQEAVLACHGGGRAEREARAPRRAQAGRSGERRDGAARHDPRRAAREPGSDRGRGRHGHGRAGPAKR